MLRFASIWMTEVGRRTGDESKVIYESRNLSIMFVAFIFLLQCYFLHEIKLTVTYQSKQSKKKQWNFI